MSTRPEPAPDWWGDELLGGHPDRRPWAVRGGHVLTYGTLREQVAATRRLLRSHGIRPGDTVVLQGAHGFTQLWSLLALWSLGAQVLLLGPQVRGRELGLLLDRCRPRFHVAFDGGPADGFHGEGATEVRRLKGGLPAATAHCLVQFTSGSTGCAKPVGRTAESLLAELAGFARVAGMPAAGERVLVLGPPAHSFPLIGGLLHAMHVGAVTVFSPGAGRPALLRAAALGRTEAVIGAPRHFAVLAADGRGLRLPRLRVAVSGGDRVDDAVHIRFGERYGVRLGQAYGTTETGIVATDPTGWYGPGTVGLPVDGVEVRVVDTELQVRLDRSPYLLPEEAPARFLADPHGSGAGWFATRDRVTRDALTGALRIAGRFDPLVDRGALSADHHGQLSSRTRSRLLRRDGEPAGSG
ncbi:class I adenylate-forming enzyme family protein [Streptomyces niger]|uniref:class I adenylate-forming enzyme family protein n=1 Tax=Streptomyces niger TaxID=66373 RepID=UPI00069A47A7|nr:AMP-binding protein [Streptomyces niger]